MLTVTDNGERLKLQGCGLLERINYQAASNLLSERTLTFSELSLILLSPQSIRTNQVVMRWVRNDRTTKL